MKRYEEFNRKKKQQLDIISGRYNAEPNQVRLGAIHLEKSIIFGEWVTVLQRFSLELLQAFRELHETMKDTPNTSFYSGCNEVHNDGDKMWVSMKYSV